MNKRQNEEGEKQNCVRLRGERAYLAIWGVWWQDPYYQRGPLVQTTFASSTPSPNEYTTSGS